MYKIGDFAKIVNSSIRTLRYYDEIDLLKPSKIDLFTNYRYYSEEQTNDFNLIKLLQDAGFSLEEIRDNWDNFNEFLFLKKKEEHLLEIEKIKDKIKKADYLRSHISEGKITFDKIKQNCNKKIIRR